MGELTFNFIVGCRNGYLSGLRPFSDGIQKTEFYNALNAIAEKLDLDTFTAFLMEGQYYIDLWAAYFILEKFKPARSKIIDGWNLSIVDDCVNKAGEYGASFTDSTQLINYNNWIARVKAYYKL